MSNNPDSLNAALSIMENADSVRALLVAPLIETVKIALKQADQFREWSFRDKDEHDLIASLRKGEPGTYKGIYIRRRSWPDRCFIGIEPQGTAVASDLIYGVNWPRADRESVKELSNELFSKLNDLKKRTSSDHWLWYDSVPALEHIKAGNLGALQTIQAIYSDQNNKVVQHFVELFERLAKIASEVLPKTSMIFKSAAAGGRGAQVTFPPNVVGSCAPSSVAR